VRKPQGAITRQALSWNPQGTRKRGRPKNTWRRDLEKDRSNIGNPLVGCHDPSSIIK
jgi:hypothetical protein